MLLAALSLSVLVAGCGTSGGRDTGTPTNCPHRNAYCPFDAAGVAWPGRPSDSPSGRFQVRVLPASPATPGADWRFEVVNKASGAVVLSPQPGLDGGLGTIVAWDQNRPDTLWTAVIGVTKWRFDPASSHWIAEPPGRDEALPPVVAKTLAGDVD